jgi:drug/metabolite transporter (DMT)-like permease
MTQFLIGIGLVVLSAVLYGFADVFARILTKKH